MAIPVEMPKMSDTMVEGVLSAWLVEEGQKVTAGDVIAQVETDKATMDLEAYDDGVLLKRVVAEGGAVPIGGLIAVLGKEGENVDALLASYGSGDGASAAPSAPAPEAAPAAPSAPAAEASAAAPAASTEAVHAPAQPASAEPAAADAAPHSDGGRAKASPLARSMAKEHGLELGAVAGTGPEGRIVRRDVEAAMKQPAPSASSAPAEAPAPRPAPAAAPAQASAAQPGDETRPNSQMRKAIARRLAESKFSAPHFYLTVDVDMEGATAFRARLNAASEKQGTGKVSVNDLVTKACAVALRRHPFVNASWGEDAITFHSGVHVAIAVAMEDGLITPVVRDADRKGLAEIAAETRDLAGRAREKKLSPDEFSGSTFTTSNLGMFGIEAFTSIINPPNACILAIGAVREEPVVKDGQIVVGSRMKLTLSCDHRVVDGARGAAFLTAVKSLLEEPLTMLL